MVRCAVVFKAINDIQTAVAPTWKASKKGAAGRPNIYWAWNRLMQVDAALAETTKFGKLLDEVFTKLNPKDAKLRRDPYVRALGLGVAKLRKVTC